MIWAWQIEHRLQTCMKHVEEGLGKDCGDYAEGENCSRIPEEVGYAACGLQDTSRYRPSCQLARAGQPAYLVRAQVRERGVGIAGVWRLFSGHTAAEAYSRYL